MPAEQTIYFAAHGGLIKIGIAINVPKRLVNIRTTEKLAGSLNLIGTMSGDYGIERKIHRCLAGHQVRGEWFNDCDKVRAFIRDLLTEGLPRGWRLKPKPTIDLGRRLTPDRLARLASLIWPDDPLGGLAECTETTRETCNDWVSGRSDMPRLHRCALACTLLKFASQDW